MLFQWIKYYLQW